MAFLLAFLMWIFLGLLGALVCAFIFDFMWVGLGLGIALFGVIVLIVRVIDRMDDFRKRIGSVLKKATIGKIFFNYLEKTWDIDKRWKVWYKGAEHKVSYERFKSGATDGLDLMFEDISFLEEYILEEGK